MLKDLFGSLFVCYSEPMNLLQWRKKEYTLWHDWHVNLKGKYECIDNGDSAQLCNEDGSRVIYGSSFVITGVDNVRNETEYLGIKDDGGSHTLTASVSQDNEFLTIAITYLSPSDEKWARSVIESAHRI